MKPPRKTEFGKPLVNSCFTFSLMVGVSVHDTTLGTLVANLGYDKLDLSQPRLRRRYPAQRERVHRPSRKQVAARTRASSPGRTAASTSATSWCANALAPRCCKSARDDRAPLLAVRPGRQRAENRQGTRERSRRRSSSISRTALRRRRRLRRAKSSRSCPKRRTALNGGCGSTRSAASITRTTSTLIGSA